MRSVSLFIVFASAIFGVVSGLAAAPPDAGLARGQAALSQLPFRFEANRGQWGPSVQFAARGGGYDLLFTGQGPSLRFGGSQGIDISLVNGNPQPVIEGLDVLKARTNYMIGARANRHTAVPTYSSVEYRQEVSVVT